MAIATPDLRLPFRPKLVLTSPTHKGMARLSCGQEYGLMPVFTFSLGG